MSNKKELISEQTATLETLFGRKSGGNILLTEPTGKLKVKQIKQEKQGFIEYSTQLGTYCPIIDFSKSKTIPAGIYRLQRDDKGAIHFVPGSTMADELLIFKDSVSDKIYKEVMHFWEHSTKERFDEKGLVYKRGIILYGDPGTGKTATIVQVMEKHVENGGIVLFNPGVGNLVKGITQMREIEPDKKVLVIFEEFDIIVNDSDFLSLLDGELMLDNICYIATTNHIDRIPARIKCRPSRFASVIEIGLPSYAHRLQYFKHKMPELDEKTLDQWTTQTEGLVIDQLKDIIVSTYCFQLSFEESLAKIREMGNIKIDEEEEINDYDD